MPCFRHPREPHNSSEVLPKLDPADLTLNRPHHRRTVITAYGVAVDTIRPAPHPVIDRRRMPDHRYIRGGNSGKLPHPTQHENRSQYRKNESRFADTLPDVDCPIPPGNANDQWSVGNDS